MANNFRRCFRSYLRFIKNSLAVDLEYRVSFVLKSLTSLVWVAGSLFFINVVFSQASEVAGWSKLGVTLLYVAFGISMDFFDLFLTGNFIYFSDSIRKGELDWLLVRPINSRFMVSLMGKGIDSSIIFRFVFAIFLVFYFMPSGTPILNVMGFFFFLILGNFAIYSVLFMVHTLNIWLVKVDNLTTFSQNTFGFTRIPLDAWPKTFRIFLVYVLPMGIASSYAVLALLGKINGYDYLIAIMVSVVLFWLSQKFWEFALRHYSSASS